LEHALLQQWHAAHMVVVKVADEGDVNVIYAGACF
jgi:hypothetical protein